MIFPDILFRNDSKILLILIFFSLKFKICPKINISIQLLMSFEMGLSEVCVNHVTRNYSISYEWQTVVTILLWNVLFNLAPDNHPVLVVTNKKKRASIGRPIVHLKK